MKRDLPKRKNLRLAGFDYGQAGYYFVTICTKDKAHLFGDISSVGATFGRPQLSPLGRAVKEELERLSEIYASVRLDKYVIMPNHIHTVLVLGPTGGRPKVAPTLSRVMQQFKGATSKRAGLSLWQKGYYDHIIRDEQDYQRIRQYIEDNPARWAEDEYYCE